MGGKIGLFTKSSSLNSLEVPTAFF
jgi:hypothetical protein